MKSKTPPQKKTPAKSIIKTYKNPKRRNKKDMSIEYENPKNKIKTFTPEKIDEQNETISSSDDFMKKHGFIADLKFKEIPEHLLPYLNKLIQNKSNFYMAVAQKGYYLPKYDSRAITGQFLWQVFTEEISCLKRNEVRQGFASNYVSKLNLVAYLEEEVGETLGFDQDHLPDRQWLVNYLYTKNPNHQVFSFGKSDEKEDQAIENKLKQQYMFLLQLHVQNVRNIGLQLREINKKVFSVQNVEKGLSKAQIEIVKGQIVESVKKKTKARKDALESLGQDRFSQLTDG